MSLGAFQVAHQPFNHGPVSHGPRVGSLSGCNVEKGGLGNWKGSKWVVGTQLKMLSLVLTAVSYPPPSHHHSIMEARQQWERLFLEMISFILQVFQTVSKKTCYIDAHSQTPCLPFQFGPHLVKRSKDNKHNATQVPSHIRSIALLFPVLYLIRLRISVPVLDPLSVSFLHPSALTLCQTPCDDVP